MKRYILCLVISIGLLAACNGDDSNTSTPTNNPGTNTPDNKPNITRIEIKDNNSTPTILGSTLTYTAIGIESTGSTPVDITTDVTWDGEPKDTLQLVSQQPGTFTTLKAGSATVAITYQGLESIIQVVITPTPPPVVNYTSLVIGGDTQVESAYAGVLLNYSAKGFTSDMQEESDLTELTNWSVVEANAPLRHIKDGQFEVESGEGTYTIKAVYNANADSVSIESSHVIKIINKPLVLTSLTTYPTDNIIINSAPNKPAHYQLQAKGFNDQQQYNLGPDLVTWSVLPNTGATIDESNGYLEVTSAGKFTVTAKFNNDNSIESSSDIIVDPLAAGIVTESIVTPDLVSGLADQIFYISNDNIVKSCPVSTTPSIDSANTTNQTESNHVAKLSECHSYILFGVNTRGILNYNPSYNKVYAFSGNSNVLYSIDILTHRSESYALPATITNIKSLVFDKAKSDDFSILSSEVESDTVKNQLTKCSLNNDGSYKVNSCITKDLKQFKGGTNEKYELQNSYMLKKDNSYLIFNAMVESKALGKSELMVLKCNANFTSESGCSIALDSTHESDQYNSYSNVLISKPSLLSLDANKTYIYSVALEVIDNPGVFTPNSFSLNESAGTLTINESEDNALDTPRYTNSSIILTYDNLALDTYNKWAYYGTATNKNVLKKCNYANNQVDENGRLTGSCVAVTNFKDIFSGIAFVPGNKSTLTLTGLDDFFFISDALIGNGKTQKVINQCVKANNESINEANCFKYDLPRVSAKSKLVLNKAYNKLYVTTDGKAMYAINPTTHRVKIYKTLFDTIKAISFSLDNTRAYLIGEKLGKLYLSNCEVSESGDITPVCAIITPLPAIRYRPTNIDMINYHNKYLYLMLDSTVYKCTSGIKGVYIERCGLIDLIDPRDGIDYNTNKSFTNFSAMHQADSGKTFIYLGAVSGTNHYVWPALIDNTTGNLSLNSALPTYSNESNLISNSNNMAIDKINFDDNKQHAYVGFSGLDDILSCEYDSNIKTTGTINLHGARTNCTSVTSFKAYQTLQLLYIPN